MKRRVAWLALCAFLLTSAFVDAQETPQKKRGPMRLFPATIDAKMAGEEAIKTFDVNKDGKLSGEEIDACPGLKAAIHQIDPDGKGEITAAMITKRIEAWQRSKLGRMSLSCMVLHNGTPLADATVRFVPEKFLGKNLQVALGKTDENGVAMISIPTRDRKDPPGVAPGFYHVEITKSGEEIPLKYNVGTSFGQEVALDAAGIREGIKYDLKY